MPEWPALPVRREVGGAVGGPEHVSRHEVRLAGHGTEVVVRRDPLAMTVRGEAAATTAIVHPAFARTAAAVAAWWGREAFQAAAVLGPAGAFAVTGASGAGKSTLAAAAALAGRTVLTDEVVVVEDGAVLAGAATAAVRRDAALLLGLPGGLREAWAGGALLLPLGPAPARTPLRGWVHLAWGARVEARPLGPSARAAALGATRLHGDQQAGVAAFLGLAALPAWRLERPRTPDGHAAALDELLRLLG